MEASIETSMSRVISSSTKGFSWEGEETPAVYRSLYDRGEETSPTMVIKQRGEETKAHLQNCFCTTRVSRNGLQLLSF